MSEKKDVVEFVREVEKYQCIYNITIPEYSNRNETKRAWARIAEVMGCTESDCKEKWRKIRIAFMRSLKQMKASNQTNKPYYLYDYLKFLLPYMKINDSQEQEESITQLSPAYSEEEEETPKIHGKIEFESDDENVGEATNGHVVYFDERVNIPDRLRNESYIQDRPRQMKQDIRKRKRIEDVEDNPRKMFMLSLLPDVESFTEEEMRTFRRSVVTCIDNIMDARKMQR